MPKSDTNRESRPGLLPERLAILMHAAIKRCQLDLSGKTVLTEAASGAYVVTPVLAAMAGAARVYALTRSTSYGSVEEVVNQTFSLAEVVGVRNTIEVITQKSPTVVARADIVTNSGHLRSIDATMIGWMKSGAVIPLMYETWEFRSDDVDLAACRQRGVLVGGTNERHPMIDVFSFLGILAIKLLTDAGVGVHASRILLLCDNPFRSFLERDLKSVGASVDVCEIWSAVTDSETYDAILIALRPRSEFVVPAAVVDMVAKRWPAIIIAQFWGDIDRSACLAAGIPVWPLEAPRPGHMGILLSEIGPDPIVRLQAGGLKAAEVLLRMSSVSAQPDCDFVEVM